MLLSISRRSILAFLSSLTGPFGIPAIAIAEIADPDLSIASLLRDPATPVGGNTEGDVTIVAFFDYNCPFCMKAQPNLIRLVAEDKKIRLVYKDWPIFGGVSMYAAQVALAAKWQGKYVAVHDALMGAPRRKASNEQVRRLAQDADADLEQLDNDLKRHGPEIAGILKRTEKQANQLDLPGTPIFLIGPFKIDQALDLVAFKRVVQDTRNRQRSGG